MYFLQLTVFLTWQEYPEESISFHLQQYDWIVQPTAYLIWQQRLVPDGESYKTIIWWRGAGLQVSSATWKRKVLNLREEEAGHEVLGAELAKVLWRGLGCIVVLLCECSLENCYFNVLWWDFSGGTGILAAWWGQCKGCKRGWSDGGRAQIGHTGAWVGG
jgi:hypothetical protein